MTVLQQLTLEDIEAVLRVNRVIMPAEAVDMRKWLAGELSFLAGRKEEIIRRKFSFFRGTEAKSEAELKRRWETSEDGINEAILTSQIKRMMTMRNSLKDVIELAQDEGRNIY